MKQFKVISGLKQYLIKANDSIDAVKKLRCKLKVNDEDLQRLKKYKSGFVIMPKIVFKREREKAWVDIEPVETIEEARALKAHWERYQPMPQGYVIIDCSNYRIRDEGITDSSIKVSSIEDLKDKCREIINNINTKKKQVVQEVETDIYKLNVYEQNYGKSDKQISGKLLITINWEKDEGMDLGWYILEGYIRLNGNRMMHVSNRYSDSKKGALDNLNYILYKLRSYIK